MAVILTKRSNTASSVPVAGDLTNSTGGAELAVNTADKRLFTKDSGGTVVELGTNPSTFSLPNGTANAVPYLNGSKVLTSGSALQFDGSNLGLGVTPSAWTGSFKAIQLPDSGVFGTQNQNLNVLANATYNSGWKYISSAYATLYSQTSGQHQWYTAPSGTAGNAISFTQAMTLNASGSLSIGTTASDNKVTVYDTNYPFVQFCNSSTGTGGNVGFRVGYEASVGAYIDNLQNSPMIFRTNAAERARIDSSGNLLVGTTSTISGGKISISFAGATQNGIVLQTTLASTGSDFMQFFNSAGSVAGKITQNGTTTVAYTTSSDYRLKENVQPMTGALAKVSALKPVTYKWKVDGSDGEGFIAHELAEVCPQAVTGEKDAVDADGNPVYQGIDTSFLAGLYAAALQELIAEVNSLKAEIQTLKGN